MKSLGVVGTSRYVLTAYQGTLVAATRNQFINFDNENVIMFDGQSGVIDTAVVRDNQFRNIGGSVYHDHSTIYTDAIRNIVSGNTAYAGVITASNAICCYEIHGCYTDVHDNFCANYEVPGNLCSSYWATDGPGSFYHWHHNQSVNCAQGLNIVPLVNMTDVLVEHNIWSINPANWPNGYQGRGYFHPAVALQAYTPKGAIQRLRIENNIAGWTTTQYATNGDQFLLWNRRSVNYTALTDSDVTVRGNTICNCPSSAVSALNFHALARWDVSDNDFYNLACGGFSPDGPESQSGVVLADGNSITDFGFNRNRFYNDQSAPNQDALFSLMTLVAGDPGSPNPTTTDVEVLDNEVRLDSPVPVPLAHTLAGQSVRFEGPCRPSRRTHRRWHG